MIITLDAFGADTSTLFRGNKHILIDVKETRDGCILAIEPIVRINDDRPSDENVAYDVGVNLDGREYPFHVSHRFVSYYSNLESISLEVRQHRKSLQLAFQIPKPLIIKTCHQIKG